MEIYWVVGQATNVGKTTISCALIKALEKRQEKPIGFKPYVGGRFRDLIDFAFDEYSSIPNKIFGADGLALCRASALTNDNDVDLVTPWQLIFNTSSDDTLFIRTGSEEIGNTQYYQSEEFTQLRTRKDIRRIGELLKWPIQNINMFDPSTTNRHLVDKQSQNLAFNCLMKRQPYSVVVEAAGPFLPVWDGNPRVNHIIVVGNDQITLIPRVNLKIEFPDKPYFTQRLIDSLSSNTRKNFKFLTISQFYSEKAHREDFLAHELEQLLHKARI